MTETLLFLQISETSFDESLLISRMLTQLGGEVQVLCLVNGISSSLVASMPGAIVGVLTENQEDNHRRFEEVISRAMPSAIVVLDLYKFFLNPLELNFLPVWLEPLAAKGVPILALDYFNLMRGVPEGLRLHENIRLPHLEAGEGADLLALKAYLLKPVPPLQPEDDQIRSFYWNPLDPSLKAAAPQLRQQVLESLEAPPDTRLVTLIYDPTLYSQALERNLLGFYFVLVEVMIYYLSRFASQRFQLLVIGSAPPTDQVIPREQQNFEVHYFSHLTEDNYRALLAASDLVVSNTTWSPALLDAAALGVPALVMANSIIQEWKDATETEKQLSSFFSPSPPLYDLCQLLCTLNQWSVTLPIFQFVTYPLRYEELSFPEPGLQSSALPYFLLDMFDDETSLPILANLLFSDLDRRDYRAGCQSLLAIAEEGISFGHLLDKVRPR